MASLCAPVVCAQKGGSLVQVQNTVLREAPGAGKPRVATLSTARWARVLARTDGWAQVRLATGTKGWVPEEDVVSREVLAADSADSDAASGAPSRGERLVRTALTYRGTPYRFGARGQGAFDCSGFTWYLWQKAGSPLPRTAAQQFKKGVPVPKAEMQPGDLVFFKNTYKRGISHVGVFIGDGKFVHAASSGRGVVVDSLSQSYYINHWAGARRPR